MAALARGCSDAARQRCLKALLSAAEFINKSETHLGAALCAGLDKSNLRFDVSTKAAHTLNDSYLSTQLLQLLDVKVSCGRRARPLRPRSDCCLQPCTAHLAAPLPARCSWVPLPPAGPRAPCVQWQNISLSERQDAILQARARPPISPRPHWFAGKNKTHAESKNMPDNVTRGTYAMKQQWIAQRKAEYLAQIEPAKRMAGIKQARFWVVETSKGPAQG